MTSRNIVRGSPKHITTTASSRALSPSRSPHSTSSTPRMPSPRTSPAIRPTSPLSPRLESNGRFEPLRPPSPRNMGSRTGNSQRRANTNTLRLPPLPRYHPANYPSTYSSGQPTPDSSGGSPQAPASPRTHQRVISDAQKQLFAYQREMMSVSGRSSTPPQLDRPASPRLVPLGSPGPVTPMMLEEDDGGYLMAGVRSASKEVVLSEELMEKLATEELRRQRRPSNNSGSISLTADR